MAASNSNFFTAPMKHMYHPMLIFERHSGCLLAARLRAGNASSHAPSCPCCCDWSPDCRPPFPKVKIQLRGDDGSLCPCSMILRFLRIQIHTGIPCNSVFLRRAGATARNGFSASPIVAPSYRSGQFSSFRHRARIGLTSAASATRPNILPSEPTCAS